MIWSLLLHDMSLLSLIHLRSFRVHMIMPLSVHCPHCLQPSQAIFFGIVSFFFNYVPEVGKQPSLLTKSLCTVDSRKFHDFRPSIASRYHHCHHHSHASDLVRRPIGISSHHLDESNNGTISILAQGECTYYT